MFRRIDACSQFDVLESWPAEASCYWVPDGENVPTDPRIALTLALRGNARWVTIYTTSTGQPHNSGRYKAMLSITMRVRKAFGFLLSALVVGVLAVYSELAAASSAEEQEALMRRLNEPQLGELPELKKQRAIFVLVT